MKKQSLLIILIVLVLALSACDEAPQRGLDAEGNDQFAFEEEESGGELFFPTDDDGVVWRTIADPETGVELRCIYVWAEDTHFGLAGLGCYDRDLHDKLDLIMEHLEIEDTG